MDLFASFKETLKKSAALLKGRSDPVLELRDAIEASDNWDGLERRLMDLRAVSRKRQQEIVERLEPLAKQVEHLLARAREAKVKVLKQNLLRQAEGYMQQLEAEDEPAKIHSANCRMLTNLIKQAQRARAMIERGIEADAIDLITTRFEEVVVAHESTLEAAGELESAGRVEVPRDVSMASIEKRLSAVYETEPTGDTLRQGVPEERDEAPDQQLRDLENKLYE
jgi:hypothetical protein